MNGRARRRTRSAFLFGAGRLSLDFTRTLAERRGGRVERLKEPADLNRWFVEAGMVEEPPSTGAPELGDAKGLREAIYGLAISIVEGGAVDEGHLAVVNGWAARSTRVPELVEAAQGFEAKRGGAEPSPLLAEIARDAVTLLGGPEAGRLRECRNSLCSAVFVDSSRGGQRLWCSMKGCGNLSKTAAYRKRKKDEGKRSGARDNVS